MDLFAPEFSRFWLPAGDIDAARERQEDEARAEMEALADLVERVAAARSIV